MFTKATEPPALGRPLFVFVDESGNFDFSESGTKHFVLSAFITSDPIRCGHGLLELTYEFLARGLSNQLPFHATENSQGTRKRVSGALCSAHSSEVHSISVDKRLAPASIHRPEALYALLGGALVTYLVGRYGASHSPIVLMFDSLFTSKQQSAFLKVLKPRLNALQVPYRITFRPVKYDVNGQIADYYAWSLFRELERGDAQWTSTLPHRHSRIELFRNGRTPNWQKNDHPA